MDEWNIHFAKRIIIATDMNFLGTVGQSWISSNLIFKMIYYQFFSYFDH